MKTNQSPSSPPPSAKELKRPFEKVEQEASVLEGLYAKVNKPKRRPIQQQPETIYAPQPPLWTFPIRDDNANGGHSPQGPTPETVYAEVGESASGESPLQPDPHIYEDIDMIRNGGQSPQSPTPETVYATVGESASGESPLQPDPHIYASPRPQETIYAPQRPLGNARDQQSPETLVNPYHVTDLQEQDWQTEYQERTNPLYEPVNMGAAGGPNSQQQENPLYEPVGSGRTTPPPRSPKDEVTAHLLNHQTFQEGVIKIQELCTIVYGNRHALDPQLAKILDDPQKGEDVSWDVAANPEDPCKLAGKTVLGMKTPKRQNAENAFGPLCAALDKHVENTQKLHRDFTREQARQQAHERREHPERSEQRRHYHHHHHHHHAREERQHSPEREAQQRKEEGKKMAFAL